MARTPGNTGSKRVSRWRAAAWSAGALVLLVPLIAMQFTDEVVWSLDDFVFAGGLVAGVGLAFELVARRTDDAAYRWAVGIALGAAFLLVWTNGAVGLIGAEGNAVNLMYYGVLAVGVGGAFVSGLRPRGMARAMSATACALALVAAIALATGAGRVADVLMVNGGFIALFAGSAWLFLRAARSGSARRVA